MVAAPSWRRPWAVALVVLAAGTFALVAAQNGSAEQAGSKQRRLPAGFLEAGFAHTCAILNVGMRCWGLASDGQLGYGNIFTIGDDEVPSAAGTVYLGPGRKARAVDLADSHTCAILDNGKVRCWGDGAFGKLGYGNTDQIGDTETAGSVGPVNLGPGRRAIALATGATHTCAILDNGKVRCWGEASIGQLGYGNTSDIGDNETPASAGTVRLGTGRTAVAIASGKYHTCAILDNGKVRCWGQGVLGQLGRGETNNIGDNETPGSVAPVKLGTGRKAVAIAAGIGHTCAILDNGKVRCWGANSSGQLGYGNTTAIGDNETPDTAGPVNLGAGRTARSIAAGGLHTCVVLDTGAVRCWGEGAAGRLGSGATGDIGDNETPGSVSPVDLGTGLTAVAVAGGEAHTCAIVDTGGVVCWGSGVTGRLGYGPTGDVGDNETAGFYGPVLTSGLVATKVLPALSLSVKPKRDKTAPFRVRASGKLTGFIGDVATCTSVTVRAKKGAKTVTKRPKLKPGAAGCKYSVRLTAKGPGKWKVTARFGGNGSLLARSASAKTFRAG